MILSNYDQWKTRSPDDWRPGDPDDRPACVHCDDAGCPECCEPVPITLDDLEEIAEQMTYVDARYGEPRP